MIPLFLFARFPHLAKGSGVSAPVESLISLKGDDSAGAARTRRRPRRCRLRSAQSSAQRHQRFGVSSQGFADQGTLRRVLALAHGIESLISLKGDDSAGAKHGAPAPMPPSAQRNHPPSAISDSRTPHDAILLVDTPTGDDRGADAEPGVGGKAFSPSGERRGRAAGDVATAWHGGSRQGLGEARASPWRAARHARDSKADAGGKSPTPGGGAFGGGASGGASEGASPRIGEAPPASEPVQGYGQHQQPRHGQVGDRLNEEPAIGPGERTELGQRAMCPCGAVGLSRAASGGV